MSRLCIYVHLNEHGTAETMSCTVWINTLAVMNICDRTCEKGRHPIKIKNWDSHTPLLSIGRHTYPESLMLHRTLTEISRETYTFGWRFHYWNTPLRNVRKNSKFQYTCPFNNVVSTWTCVYLLASSPDLSASFGMRNEAEGLVSQVTWHDVRIERQVER